MINGGPNHEDPKVAITRLLIVDMHEQPYNSPTVSNDDSVK